MARETFVTCDRDGCNSRVQVPSPDAIPAGWVAVRYYQVSLKDNSAQAITKLMCGWKCLMHFTKDFITLDDKK